MKTTALSLDNYKVEKSSPIYCKIQMIAIYNFQLRHTLNSIGTRMKYQIEAYANVRRVIAVQSILKFNELAEDGVEMLRENKMAAKKNNVNGKRRNNLSRHIDNYKLDSQPKPMITKITLQ